MSDGRHRAGTHYAPMVVVLILAAGLRWMNNGLEPLSTDEAAHSLKAIAVARHGKLELLGPIMPYFNFRAWHGPVSIYLYALPFLVSTDPRLAVMLTAATHVIATSLVFAIGGRYFNRRVGMISSVLFAVHPEAIYMARGIWNPMFMTPFALAYVWTGLMGYCSGHKWARVAHLPMLTMGGQCHPGTFLLAPISLLIWVRTWNRNPRGRQASVVDTLSSVTLALLLTMPWIIGVYLDNINNLPMPGVKLTTLISENAAASDPSDLRMFARMYQQLGNWEQNWTQPIQPLITIVGSIILLAFALRRKQDIAGGVVALGYILPPLMIKILSARYEDHFIWAGYGFAFLIQGVVIGKVLPSVKTQYENIFQKSLQWTALIVLSLLVLTQILFSFRYDRGFRRVSLDDYMAATDIAAKLATNTGREMLMLASDKVLAWEVLREGHDARVVWPDRAMPLPQYGAVMLGPADYDSRPFVFSGGKIIQGSFRITELPPADHFKPDLIPLNPIRFSNGVRVFGFLREIPGSMPQAGQPWTIFIIWRIDKVRTNEYKVFTHLVDKTGYKHAQADVSGLPVGQQRLGEYVMTQLNLEPGDSLPDTGPLYLRFGMYNDGHNADVIDVSDNIVGASSMMQIRAGAEHLAVWDGIALADLVIKDQIQQGPPLEIAATWHILHSPADDLNLRWRLLSEDETPVLEMTTDLVPDMLSTVLPHGVLTTEQYQLRIPTDIMPGRYILALDALDGIGNPVGDPFRTAVRINPREHTFAAPPMEHTINSNFGGEILLLGYDLERDGENMQLTITWQARAEMRADYKFFVHMWREGQIVSQIDSMPRNNQYPTSWWIMNEIVTESVHLTIPGPGKYTLTTGFYNPTDGVRLPVLKATGKNASQEWVVLDQLLVTE